MNESDLDRRLARWMADRDPGPLPATLRVSAGRVPYETPIPISLRIRDTLVGPVERGRPAGGTPRWALVLLAAGLLLAATITSLLLAGSMRPSPALGVDRWGAFVVDQPAPTTVLPPMPGGAVVTDDDTIEFEDFFGSVVAVLVPGSGSADRAARDLAAFTEVRRLTGNGVVFVVGARSAAVMDGFAADGGAAAVGIGAFDLSTPGGATVAFPEGDDALVLVDRDGTVAAAFVGELPGRDQLITLLERLEVRR